MIPAVKRLELRATFINTGKPGKTTVFTGTETARRDIELVNGAYSGTVPITLTRQNSALSDITGYRVELYLVSYEGKGMVLKPTSDGSGPPWAQAKTGTELVSLVQGSFGPGGLAPAKP
jgi:hypothetical protein